MRSALGDAPQGSFKLPEYDGQKRDERFKTVKLGVVEPFVVDDSSTIRRSARRATVRAMWRAAAAGDPPGRTKERSGSRSPFSA